MTVSRRSYVNDHKFELKCEMVGLKYKTDALSSLSNNPRARGPFFEGPEKFSHPESRSKILNLRITELFYLHILNINRGSLHTRSFMAYALIRFQIQMNYKWLYGPEKFPGLSRNGPLTRLSISCDVELKALECLTM